MFLFAYTTKPTTMKTTNEKFEKAIQIKCNSKFSLNDRDQFLPSYEGLSLISSAHSFGYKRPQTLEQGNSFSLIISILHITATEIFSHQVVSTRK
jgi:hypothetical protein